LAPPSSDTKFRVMATECVSTSCVVTTTWLAFPGVIATRLGGIDAAPPRAAGQLGVSFVPDTAAGRAGAPGGVADGARAVPHPATAIVEVSSVSNATRAAPVFIAGL